MRGQGGSTPGPGPVPRGPRRPTGLVRTGQNIAGTVGGRGAGVVRGALLMDLQKHKRVPVPCVGSCVPLGAFARSFPAQEYGELLLGSGDAHGAVAAYRDVESICSSELGSGHPDTATARVGVATALKAGGRWEDAVVVCQYALSALGIAVMGECEDECGDSPGGDGPALLTSPVKFDLGTAGANVPTPAGQRSSHGDSVLHSPMGTSAASRPLWEDDSEGSSTRMAPYLSQSDSGSEEQEEDAHTSTGPHPTPKWSPLKTGNLAVDTARHPFSPASGDSAGPFSEAGVLVASPTSAVDTFSCVADARAAAAVSVLTLLCALSCAACPCSPCSSELCYSEGARVCARVCSALHGRPGEAHPDTAAAHGVWGAWAAAHGRLDAAV